MKTIASLVMLLLTIGAPSCATQPAASMTQLSEASTPSSQVVAARAPSATDVLRARKIEIVDGQGRPRIVMEAHDTPGMTALHFLDSGGEAVWSAMQYDQVANGAGEGKFGPAFLIQGEVGAVYSLWVSPRGCALHMGADQDDDEGGIGIGHYDGKSFITLSASKAEEGDPEEVGVQLELLGNRIVVSDINDKEIASFPAPAALPGNTTQTGPVRADITPSSPAPK